MPSRCPFSLPMPNERHGGGDRSAYTKYKGNKYSSVPYRRLTILASDTRKSRMPSGRIGRQLGRVEMTADRAAGQHLHPADDIEPRRLVARRLDGNDLGIGDLGDRRDDARRIGVGRP